MRRPQLPLVRPPGRRDVLLTAGVLAVQVGGTLAASRTQPGSRPLDAIAFMLLAAGPLSLLGRRWTPAVPVLVTLTATIAYFARGHPRGPIFVSSAIALFGAVLAGRRALAWFAGALLVTAMATAVLLGAGPAPGPVTVTVVAAWLVVVLLGSDQVRIRRERTAEHAAARREEARRFAGEERLRLARDLHDVLAHSLSVINVQAGVALHLMDDDPAQVRPALTVIRQTSKDALTEVRETLGALRGGEDVAAPRAPAAGLAELDHLLAGVRATGLRVHAEVTGVPRTVPAAVDLAAYRIVQEALTNVARHSTATGAHVSLRYGEHRLDVVVDDEGPAREPQHGAGHGILGMTERATALGGAVEAGPRDGGGYRVRARLPLRGDR